MHVVWSEGVLLDVIGGVWWLRFIFVLVVYAFVLCYAFVVVCTDILYAEVKNTHVVARLYPEAKWEKVIFLDWVFSCVRVICFFFLCRFLLTLSHNVM